MDEIKFYQLNDFIFCPVSLYFLNLFGAQSRETYISQAQIMGEQIHEKVDEATYSTSKDILQGITCYCEKYGLIGKIDIFDSKKGILTERKRLIKEIYDGYVFQLYAQYFSLKEMGYTVKEIRFYSYLDNKVYKQLLPENNPSMFKKFEDLIFCIRNFDFSKFSQTNIEKCKNCVYEPACDRSLI